MNDICISDATGHINAMVILMDSGCLMRRLGNALRVTKGKYLLALKSPILMVSFPHLD